MSSIHREGYKLLKYSLLNQKSFVLLQLHKQCPMLNYTFLQSDLKTLPNFLRPYLDGMGYSLASTKRITSYLDDIQKVADKLQKITQNQITRQTLQDADVKNISLRFVQVKYYLQQQFTNYLHQRSELTDLSQAIFTPLSFNVLQHQLWSKILLLTTKNYKNLNLLQKVNSLSTLLNYLQKYKYGYKKQVNKFMFRQTCLQDLLDFNYFIKITSDIQLFRDYDPHDRHNHLKFRIFRLKVKIMTKLLRTMNISIGDVLEQYKLIRNWVYLYLDHISMFQVIQLYGFFTTIFGYDQKMVRIFEQKIFKIQQQNKSYDLAQPDLIKIKNNSYVFYQFVEIWKKQNRYDPKIYEKFFQPYFKQIFYHNLSQNKLNPESWTNIIYSLIGCGITQVQGKFIQQVLTYLQKNHHRQLMKSHGYKSIKRFLLIKKKQKENKDLKLHIEQQLKYQKSTKYSNQAIQFNPVEAFWYKIIKSFMQQQLQKDKLSQDKIQDVLWKSQHICGFQIDILAKYKGLYFGLQISGIYFSEAKNNNRIRQAILKAYGINFISLSTRQLQPNLIMRFRRYNEAKTYAKNLFQKKYQQIKSKIQVETK